MLGAGAYAHIFCPQIKPSDESGFRVN